MSAWHAMPAFITQTLTLVPRTACASLAQLECTTLRGLVRVFLVKEGNIQQISDLPYARTRQLDSSQPLDPRSQYPVPSTHTLAEPTPLV